MVLEPMGKSPKQGFGVNVRMYPEEFHSPSPPILCLFGNSLRINIGISFLIYNSAFIFY